MMANENPTTLALHADNVVPQESDVAPSIRLRTTLRYLNTADDAGSQCVETLAWAISTFQALI